MSKFNTQNLRGAQKCLKPTTMTVTCALEDVRKRGYMSRRDTKHMSQSEYNDYVQLAAAEWGITSWDPTDRE